MADTNVYVYSFGISAILSGILAKKWDLAVDVMDLFKKAKLKLRSAMATTKPDFKQQYLRSTDSLLEL